MRGEKSESANRNANNSTVFHGVPPTSALVGVTTLRPPVSWFVGCVRVVGAHGNCGRRQTVSKAKKAKPAESAPTPGTIVGEKIRTRANKLSDTEREVLMGDAMRIVYSSQGDAVCAHRR